MHSHNTLAPAHRYRRALAVLGLAAAAALAPSGARAQPMHDAAPAKASSLAGTAAATPAGPADRVDALHHGASMLAQALHRQDLAAPQPARVAHAAPVAGDGFGWVDGAIGAGLTAALLLGAAGVTATRRRPTITAR